MWRCTASTIRRNRPPVQAMMFTDRRYSGARRSSRQSSGSSPGLSLSMGSAIAAFGGRYGGPWPGRVHAARDGNDMSRVTEQLASAWVAFARPGSPNTSRLPPWPTYDPQTRATMVLARRRNSSTITAAKFDNSGNEAGAHWHFRVDLQGGQDGCTGSVVKTAKGHRRARHFVHHQFAEFFRSSIAGGLV